MSSCSPPHKHTKLQHPTHPQPQPPPPETPSTSATLAPPARLGLSSNLAQQSTKKLVLKPKTRTSTINSTTSASSIDSSITTLARAVRSILTSTPTPVSLTSLYSLCHQVVTSGPSAAQALYDRLRLELERHCVSVRNELRGEQHDGPKDRWLETVQQAWQRWLDQMLLVRSVLLQLDRSYVLQTPALVSIWDLGLDIFRSAVIDDEALSQQLTSHLLSLIDQERNGDVVPRPLISTLRTLLHTFSPSSHTTLFVTPLLASTRAYYTTEGTSLAATLEPTDYLRRVIRRLSEEEERCELVYGVDLQDDVAEGLLETLVRGHVEAIVEKALGSMVDENQIDDLSNLYTLLSRTSSLTTLRAAFLEHLKSVGLQTVQDESQDANMVPNLIALRQKWLSIVRDAFTRNREFDRAVSSSFEFFINKRENKPAEMMAKFLDAKLRSGNRSMDDAQLEAVLGDVLFLFRFTQGKDIFEAFYKRDLAKRLLLNKSASFDAERSMLSKLKDECGPGFTAKLEIMFKDIELSDDIMRAFGSFPCSTPSPFDLNVSILSQGNWPTFPVSIPILPPSMVTALTRFKAFYTSKYSGRTLTWAHALDHCSVRAKFPKGGRKELAVSLWQTLVLLLFNDLEEGARLSFEEIREQIGIDEKETARTLQSLACGKVRVLQKHPKGRDVNPSDQFSFNADFKDDHVKIKINQIQQKETVEENKETTTRVFTDRSSHLQLAIVRIMKARKTLKYSELVMEVVSQIGHRFKVETSEIKKSISSLIDREYMRRSEDQQNVFEYVA